MSRSRRKTPIVQNCCTSSEKAYKVRENRKHRRSERIAVDRNDDPPARKEYGNPWCGPKDGKHWCPGDDRLMRK